MNRCYGGHDMNARVVDILWLLGVALVVVLVWVHVPLHG
jgi:hypothetical protein